MAVKSLSGAAKARLINFRINEKVYSDLTEVRAKCEQMGIKVNLSPALEAAVEREIKALQKHIQGIEPAWAPGQMSLAIDDSANAHTKDAPKVRAARKKTKENSDV